MITQQNVNISIEINGIVLSTQIATYTRTKEERVFCKIINLNKN